MVSIPSALNEVVSRSEEEDNNKKEDVKQAQREYARSQYSKNPNKKLDKITIKTVLVNRHAFFALLVCLVGTYNITFFTPYIAVFF